MFSWARTVASRRYEDLDLRELACIIPLAVLAVVLGVLPTLILNWMQPSVNGLINALTYTVR